MVDTLDDGRTVEVGIIGCEGIVGINIFLGGLATPDKAIVQLAGSAITMRARDLREELRFGSALQRLLLHYARTFLAVISQSVACCPRAAPQDTHVQEAHRLALRVGVDLR